jgi:glucosylceramidase
LVNEAYPNTNLLFTEGCKEAFDINKTGNWQLGEKYAANMINDFNNGMVGFTDWNILLDETGGPNHVQNFCFAPIHGNTKTGELIFTNEYYYIGHFSKFIKPGAKRIVSSASRSQLLTTAFINPDGKIAVIVMNLTDKPADYLLWVNGKAASVSSLPHSINTLIIE